MKACEYSRENSAATLNPYNGGVDVVAGLPEESRDWNSSWNRPSVEDILPGLNPIYKYRVQAWPST